MRTKRHPPNPDPENTDVELCVAHSPEGASMFVMSKETYETYRKRVLREALVAISWARISAIDAELLIARARGELKRVEQNLKKLEADEDGKLSSSSDTTPDPRGPGGCCR